MSLECKDRAPGAPYARDNVTVTDLYNLARRAKGLAQDVRAFFDNDDLAALDRAITALNEGK